MTDTLPAVLEKIEALLHAAENRGFGLLEYEEGGMRLHLAFDAAGARVSADPVPSGEQPRGAPMPPVSPQAPAEAGILSPGVGLLICSHPAGGRFPVEGDTVAAGAIVALLRAGPLLQPVTAPRAGQLGQRLVPEGTGVGFGTALFEFF